MLRCTTILLMVVLFMTACGQTGDLALSTTTSRQTLREAPPSMPCYSPPPFMEAPYPPPDEIPSAPALVDLGSTTFPNDANILRGIVANLPGTISGHQRTNFIENEYFFGVEYTEIGRPADEHPSFLRIYISARPTPAPTPHYPWDRFELFTNETIQRDQDVFWTEREWQESVSKPDMLNCYPTVGLH